MAEKSIRFLSWRVWIQPELAEVEIVKKFYSASLQVVYNAENPALIFKFDADERDRWSHRNENLLQIFLFVNDPMTEKARLFVPAKFFQASLVLAYTTRSQGDYP